MKTLLRHRWNEFQYGWLARKARMPFGECDDTLHSELKEEGYFSQCGQDKLVAEQLLPGLRNGIFVEIGAHDGITYSNTVYLERERGWQGIAVEPIPEVFNRLQRNRRCQCLNACIGKADGTVRFQALDGYSQMLSGIVDEYDERHLDRIGKELVEHGGEAREIEVQCFRMCSLLELYGVTSIDYLSIDVEGGEYDILLGLDFSRISVKVIGVENNYRDARIPRLLVRNGYVFHAMAGDEFYVHSISDTGVTEC